MVYGGQEIIAADAALLLPSEALERARAINSLLYAERTDGFHFGPTLIPHISLAQMFVRRSSLLTLIERLDGVLRDVEPLRLSVSRLATRNSLVALRLDRTPELLRLHARLMDAVRTVEDRAGSVESFHSAGKRAREDDVRWVTHFRRRASYDRYRPHVTLGYGTPPAPDVFLEFTVSQAGLFHLGRFCTCCIALHQWKF